MSEWRNKILELYSLLPKKAAIAEPKKSRKVLMMMKAAKLGWAGPGAGQEQTKEENLKEYYAYEYHQGVASSLPQPTN